MLATGLTRKPGTIAIIMDERLSRERGTLLARVINSMRTFTTVEILAGGTDEDQLLQKMEKGQYDLILVPWYRYLAWSRAEAFWGLTRTSGPTLAGYYCEQLLPYELGDQAEHLRAILLDFSNLAPSEICALVKSLQKDTLRSGIKPLLDADTKIYVENWYGGQGLGSRIDAFLATPELQEAKWSKRGNSMRITLNALWSLIYEEGPGKSDLAALAPQTPKAYFQLACDREMAVFRLCYATPGWSPRDALTKFWPNPKTPSAPAQLLLKYPDFLRVHTFSNSQGLEIVAGFFPSAPSEQAHGQVQTLWVEPLAINLLDELPYEAPGPAAPRLRPLCSGDTPRDTPRDTKDARDAAKLRAVSDSNVIELETQLKKKEAIIQELKAGGVGTAAPLPPPDPEQLLEAFQERYFDARFQIRQLVLEIVAAEKNGGTPQELTNLRQKMEALANREQAWIKKLAGTIEIYRAARGK